MDSSVYVGMLLLNRSLERIATALETLAKNQNAEVRPSGEVWARVERVRVLKYAAAAKRG